MAEKKTKSQGQEGGRRKSDPEGEGLHPVHLQQHAHHPDRPPGNAIAWSSGGTSGFKGSRKSTPYAAQMAAQQAARKAMDQGMRQVDVFVKGPGSGREAAIRALQSAGLAVLSIRDVTPIPHNGCRPPKRRRI